jgi:2-C-methyl-D-erythritol 4-phosphate cytidylyltransferase
VRLGLAEVGEEATVVLVHDAARPYLPPDVIERVLMPLSEGWDAVVPALPIPDTVKRVERDTVVETLDRKGLVAVQTPQAVVAPVLREALARFAESASDCASLVERAGGRVKVVRGDPRLLKVTDPEDLERCERLLGEE